MADIKDDYLDIAKSLVNKVTGYGTETEYTAYGAIEAQLATASALIALIDRLDNMTSRHLVGDDGNALRTYSYNNKEY